MKPAMTPREVAENLRLSLRTVHHLLRTGKLPATKVGGKWRVSEDALEELLRGETTAQATGDEGGARPPGTDGARVVTVGELFAVDNPLAVVAARLATLREDLLTGLAGATAEALPALDGAGKRLRVVFFMRQMLQTIGAMKRVVEHVDGSAAPALAGVRAGLDASAEALVEQTPSRILELNDDETKDALAEGKDARVTVVTDRVGERRRLRYQLQRVAAGSRAGDGELLPAVVQQVDDLLDALDMLLRPP